LTKYWNEKASGMNARQALLFNLRKSIPWILSADECGVPPILLKI
jgi:hypothetical protein